MRHKGNILPDIVGDEAWEKFETHVRNNRACKMPTWFLSDKSIRLGPDDKGITSAFIKFDIEHELWIIALGNRVPIISCEKPGVKKHDLYDHEPSKVKRQVITCLPTPAPAAPFTSTVRIGSTVKINGRDEPIQNNEQIAGNIPNSERDKIESKSLVYCRVNINTLKALRLGKHKSFFQKDQAFSGDVILWLWILGNENVQNEQVGSDDEDERKGTTREYIVDWITKVNEYTGRFETRLGWFL